MKSQFKYIAIILLLSFGFSVSAQEPAGYYQSAVGQKDAALKTALYNIIRTHTVLEYYSSSTSFLKTDWHPDGYIWDMYSSNKRASWYGMNREHSLPKSWWSAAPETTVAYSDLHNLYPSDATANMAKSNYPLGEVGGTATFSNGVTKVGSNAYPGYNGVVFEPANDYKGDFARDYMYVVTCYEDYANNWRSTGASSMLLGGTYPVFRPWAIAMLLKWCRQDPVSQKEIVRNNAVYKLQKNRNPFIDHPELVEFIWGKYMGSTWENDGIIPIGDVPLQLYPNPVTTSLKVMVTKPTSSHYFIDDISGVNLLAGTFAADGTIDVSSLKTGMYLIRVYTAGRKQIGKFFVAKNQ